MTAVAYPGSMKGGVELTPSRYVSPVVCVEAQSSPSKVYPTGYYVHTESSITNGRQIVVWGDAEQFKGGLHSKPWRLTVR